MMSLVHAEILHAMITIVSLYLSLLFGWWAGRQWWLQMEPVSKIFLFTGFLMLGIAFSHGGAWYGYYTNLHCDSAMVDSGFFKMILAWWWPYRSYVQLISLVAYAIYVTNRACFLKRAKLKREDL